MKVIQIIPNLCMGGAETMCKTLTLELTKNGVEVIVVSLYNYETPITQRLTEAGVKIEFLNKKRGLDLSIIKKLKLLFDREKPDAVHSHLDAQKYVMIAANQSKVPVRMHTVHTLAEKEYGWVSKFLAKTFYQKHNVIPVALSKVVQESISTVYELPLESIPVILNGIDLTNCITKENYSIGEDIKILHIGRFSKEKNHKGLIDAFKIFHTVRPNSILELIGDGPMFDEIKQYVIDQNLGNAVVFLGLQSNVYQYINNADIFVLPSLYEGIPLTLIEAMGTGIPIVATKVGGIPNMLTNNESALLTSLDSSEIANAFEELYNDADLRERLGKNALVRSKEFSSEEMARKYLAIFEE